MKIEVDPTEAESQAKELAELVRVRYPDGAPDDLVQAISDMANDRVVTKSTVADKGGEIHLISRFRFGKTFDALKAALTGGASNN